MGSLAAIALSVFLGSTGQAEETCAQRIVSYRSALAALREGNPQLREELQLAARALCELCERCDAPAVAAYYLGLSPDDLAHGLQSEARFLELFAAVQAAGREGLAGEAWQAERARLLLELRSLAETVASEADYVPAARAWSLAARLDVAELESAPESDAARSALLAESAQRDASRALDLFGRAGLLTPQLEPLWLRARLDFAARRFGAARAGFEEVRALARRVGDDDYREHGLRGLVRLARAAGDARGEDRLLIELATFRDPRSSWPLARDWAGRLLDEEHPAEAVDFLERCAPAAEAHAQDNSEWDLLMGGALLRLDELEPAREHLERAALRAPSELAVLALAQLALREERGFEVRALLEDGGRRGDFSPRAEVEALRILGEERLLAGDGAGALRELERALDRASDWRRSLDLEARAPDDGTLGHHGVESVFGEWAGLHTLALTAEALRLEQRPLEALRRIAQSHSLSLREARGGAETLRALAAGEDPTIVSAEDLASWVRANELGLVAWVLGADFGVVVAAWDQDGELVAHSARVSAGRATLADGARRLREAAIAGDRARVEREGRALRAALLPQAIWEPLAARARELGRAARLLALTHGPLEALPLELLPIDDAGGRLDDLLVLATLPGLTDRRPPQSAGAGALEAWTLLGAPQASAGFAALPAAGLELEEIAALRPGAQLARGESCTRADIARALGSGRALHIATHLTSDDAGELALVTGDGGRLTTRDVRALSGPLPLVVLTACETGGGVFVDGQGLHGLARAFLETGTEALVVTLWPVADEPARVFAVAFHQALIAAESPARATRTARAALRSAGYGPSEWAAFRMLGAR